MKLRVGSVMIEIIRHEHTSAVGDLVQYRVSPWLADHDGQTLPCTVKAFSGVSALVILEDGRQQWMPEAHLVTEKESR